MKKFIFACYFMILSLLLFSQAPQSFKYQAVARNAGGELLVNQTVSVKISLRSSSPVGPVVYSEEHFPFTNAQGLFTLDIGNPDNIISGDFTTINWSSGSYFMQVELDAGGGSTYQLMGTTQLLSVPYALYAERAGIAEDEDWLIAGNNLLSNTSGNVGIGTATPTEKLHVGGNIRTTGDLQVDNWIKKADNDGIDWFNSNQKFYPENSQIFNLQGGNAAGTLMRMTSNSNGYFGGVFGTADKIGLTNVDDEFQVYTLHSGEPGYTGNLYFPNGVWSGDAPNNTGKIQYSSGQFYFNVGYDATRIATFRHLTQDVVQIEKNGTTWFNGSGYFNGRLGVGTSSPDASAKIEVKSQTQGFLPPRLTGAEIEAITSPAEGLMVYNKSTKSMCWFDGSRWTNSNDGKSCGTIDYGGETYTTVSIGNQCWMARNLNIGAMIVGPNQTNNGIFEKYCMNDDTANCYYYGGLYQWDEMMQYTTTEGAQGICPTGLHIPTKDEWDELSNYLGGNEVAGGKLKETGNTHWLTENKGATNESGFTALAGGYYNNNYFMLHFWVWSSTIYPLNTASAYNRFIFYDTEEFHETIGPRTMAVSVRCLKDD